MYVSYQVIRTNPLEKCSRRSIHYIYIRNHNIAMNVDIDAIENVRKLVAPLCSPPTSTSVPPWSSLVLGALDFFFFPLSTLGALDFFCFPLSTLGALDCFDVVGAFDFFVLPFEPSTLGALDCFDVVGAFDFFVFPFEVGAEGEGAEGPEGAGGLVIWKGIGASVSPPPPSLEGPLVPKPIGAFVLPLVGAFVLPDGAFVLPDGAFVLPDGALVLPSTT